ncbi:uncharacterized protein LOC126853330 [Cataglyphis hispanica]|uniref:uncharacterized protein LOC126853330 n=1 Tax=Cataglyphis hispanica TaxID=1086592 RepID=UPI00217F9B40|nr:uncharacterized protein LOC126853330 [Cataglyphis hispanica]XP_050454922.1 uncharacterized protein LOC126853330 [Cataglyphis hispanica]XP_050454923.1 uncharacterized protein LOC126853330 [Cataglyphis hispanica]XP_050454924.1 uncharacterized protein LOC126853330 [Cataglyphis hispanica]
MRMEALFQIGEFGLSLTYAYEGMRRHGMTFEHGVYQAYETIEDCIGRNTSPMALLLLYPWIQRLCEYRELLIGKLEVEEDEFEGIDEDKARFKVNDPEVQRQARIKKLQRVIVKMDMDGLTSDKHFFEEISSRPEMVASPNKISTAKLLALARTCHRNAMNLQELLRMRRPIYTLLFQRQKILKRRKMMIEHERKLRRNIIVLEADFLLHRLYIAKINKDYLTFFKLIDRIKNKFDSYSDKMFPLKQKCLDVLYKMVACVYINTRNLTCLDNEELKTTYLKHHLGIRVAILPRDSDIAWISNPKQTLKMFRRRLAMASTPLELAWLHHEFCKFLIGIHRFDLVRFYAKKGRDIADEAACEEWILNFDHLILRIEIYQNNRNEARDAAVLALECARKLGIDCLIDFYERAIKVVDELDLERINDFDDVIARQQLIVELMPKEMKEEVNFLWRRMNVVPAKRRLSVMPGCKPIDRKFKMPCMRRTILPSPPKDPERDARIALLKQYVPPHKRPGFVNFEEFE